MEDVTINGLTIKIDYDQYAENPLDMMSAEERGVYFALRNPRYDLPWEIDAIQGDYRSWTDLAESLVAKDQEMEGKVYKFVHWYEHSGIAVSLHDDEKYGGWDAAIVGVIFGETTEEIEMHFGPWKNYIEGDVYEYTIENPKNGELIDSCSGFYGYEDVYQCAKAEALAFVWPSDAAYAFNASKVHA